MTFLSWAAEPEHDERKLMGAKWIAVLSLVRLPAPPSPAPGWHRAPAWDCTSACSHVPSASPARQVFLTTIYYKRWKWAPLKSRRIVVDVVN